MTRVYLSGPMSGLPDFNYSAFSAAAAELRALGLDVVNPAEIEHAPDADWEDYLRRDLAELLTCAAVAVLPGWEASRGAVLELHVAQQLGMPTVPVSDLIGPSSARAVISTLTTPKASRPVAQAAPAHAHDIPARSELSGPSEPVTRAIAPSAASSGRSRYGERRTEPVDGDQLADVVELRRIGPGERLVDGEVLYSAAWLGEPERRRRR